MAHYFHLALFKFWDKGRLQKIQVEARNKSNEFTSTKIWIIIVINKKVKPLNTVILLGTAKIMGYLLNYSSLKIREMLYLQLSIILSRGKKVHDYIRKQNYLTCFEAFFYFANIK